MNRALSEVKKKVGSECESFHIQSPHDLDRFNSRYIAFTMIKGMLAKNKKDRWTLEKVLKSWPTSAPGSTRKSKAGERGGDSDDEEDSLVNVVPMKRQKTEQIEEDEDEDEFEEVA